MKDDSSKQEEAANDIEQVPNKQTASVGFLHTFFAQGDWDGRIAQETWYGHHYTWCRILLFLLLSSISFSSSFLSTVNLTPFFASDYTFDAFSDDALSCIDSMCAAVQDETPVACDVNQYGQAHVVWEGYEGLDRLPMPNECLVAVQSLFALDLETDDEWKFIRDWDILVVRGHSKVDPANKTAWFTLKDDQCALSIDDSQAPIPLTSHEHGPGRITGILEYHVCREMWTNNQEKVHEFRAAAEFAFENRHTLTRLVVLWVSIMVNVGRLFRYMVQLLLTTMVIRMVLPKPSSDFVGMQRITFWSTWRTLVVHSVLTGNYNDHGVIPLFLILIAGSVYYKEKRATMEWTFLAVLNLGFDSAYPLFDGMVSAVQTVDALNVVGFAGWLLRWITPGHGWWKLVHFYFFCNAYPPMRQWIQGKLPVLLSADRDEKEQQDFSTTTTKFKSE